MKVRFIRTEFVVNEEKRTVACIITARVTLSNRQEKIFYNDLYENSLTKLFKVAGVSKCHENDEFDLVRGKRIAESRAKAKVYEEGKVRLAKVLNYLDIFGEDIQDQIEKLKKYQKKEKEHLIELKEEIAEELGN